MGFGVRIFGFLDSWKVRYLDVWCLVLDVSGLRVKGGPTLAFFAEVAGLRRPKSFGPYVPLVQV